MNSAVGTISPRSLISLSPLVLSLSSCCHPSALPLSPSVSTSSLCIFPHFPSIWFYFSSHTRLLPQQTFCMFHASLAAPRLTSPANAFPFPFNMPTYDRGARVARVAEGGAGQGRLTPLASWKQDERLAAGLARHSLAWPGLA